LSPLRQDLIDVAGPAQRRNHHMLERQVLVERELRADHGVSTGWPVDPEGPWPGTEERYGMDQQGPRGRGEA